MPRKAGRARPPSKPASDSDLSPAPVQEDSDLDPTKSTTLGPSTSSEKKIPAPTRGQKRPAKEDPSPSKRARRSATGPNYKEAQSSDIDDITAEPPLKKKTTIRKKGAVTVDSHSTASKTSTEGSNVEVAEPQQNGKGRKKDTAAPQPESTSTAKADTNTEKNLKVEATEEHAETSVNTGANKFKKPRKTKEESEAETMPFAARTAGLKMYIGAHMSTAKGVHNAVTNCVQVGGNAFACFLKSQRRWENPPLNPENVRQFGELCAEHKYDAASHVLPHGSYLVNLAQKDPEKARQAYRSFVEDLKRCETLGIKLYNFHPGSTGTHPRPEAIGRIAAALNRAHKETSTVIPVLETMAGQGNVIGSTFEDLRDIIAAVDDKSRIGVCLDTCHVFAAGMDLREPDTFRDVIANFEKTVGLPYLMAVHLNDSKTPLGSRRDLHQNIGLGFLGLRAFHNLMNDARFENLPLILETPCDDEQGNEDKATWAREIKLLESLIGMDATGAEFGRLEKELADKGAESRKKFEKTYEEKMLKEASAMERWLGIGVKKEGDKDKGMKKRSKKKGNERDEGCESCGDPNT